MKKYFIFTSITGIISSIYSFIKANNLITDTLNSTKDLYKQFPEEFIKRTTDLILKIGPNFIRITSILTIIFSLIILFNTIRGNIKKTTFIVLSILCFILSNYLILQILFLINIILCSKIKEDAKEKKQIPKIEIIKPTKAIIIKCIVLLMIYFSQFIWGDHLPNNKTFVIIVQITFYLGLFILCLLFFKNTFKENFKLFKSNFSAYLKFIISRYLIGMGIFIVVNLISILITKKTTSVNQGTLETLPMWHLLPLAIIWAPIVEETIYRFTLRNFIKNDKLFIIISALLFGFMHVINEANLFNMIISLLPYATFGGILAYIYTKTNNLFSNIFIHFIQNTLSCILLILL